MFLTPLLERFLRSVIALIFIAAGIYTFGNAQLFDRLYIITLVIVGIFVRKDINIILVMSLLALQRINEEIGYFLVDQPHVIFKIIIYALAILGCYFLRKDSLKFLLYPLLIICIGAEIYWQQTSYNAPLIWWHLFLTMNAVLIRKLIWQRELWTKRHYPHIARSLDIDYYIYELNLVYICANAAVIIEYMVRHILQLKDYLEVYYSFPYISHSMTVLTLVLLLDQTIKNINSRTIKA